ncbi:MAG: hypothetical protein Q4C96_02645 [Planctomycetia bacterium]|nr:hypothetical protein [Planctomycetia bacterium]
MSVQRQFFIMMLAVTGMMFWVLEVRAQSVQLPTFSRTGVSTTVSVPDRGRVYMGGVNRSAYGSSQGGTPFLPFQNRSSGRSNSVNGISTSVYVHDFEAMEADLLSRPGGNAAVPRRASSRQFLNVQDNVSVRRAVTQAAASEVFSLDGRANRALRNKRNEMMKEELNLSVKEKIWEKNVSSEKSAGKR